MISKVLQGANSQGVHTASRWKSSCAKMFGRYKNCGQVGKLKFRTPSTEFKIVSMDLDWLFRHSSQKSLSREQNLLQHSCSSLWNLSSMDQKNFSFPELMRNTVGHYSIFLSFRIMRFNFLPRSKERAFLWQNIWCNSVWKKQVFHWIWVGSKSPGIYPNLSSKAGILILIYRIPQGTKTWSFFSISQKIENSC